MPIDVIRPQVALQSSNYCPARRIFIKSGMTIYFLYKENEYEMFVDIRRHQVAQPRRIQLLIYLIYYLLKSLTICTTLIYNEITAFLI